MKTNLIIGQESELQLIKFELELCRQQIQSTQVLSITPFQGSPLQNNIQISPSSYQFLSENPQISFSKLIQISIRIIQQNQNLWKQYKNIYQNREQTNKEIERLLNKIVQLSECLDHTKENHQLQNQRYEQRLKQLIQRNQIKTESPNNSKTVIQLERLNIELQAEYKKLLEQTIILREMNISHKLQKNILIKTLESEEQKFRKLNRQFLQTSHKLKVKCLDYEYVIRILEEKIKIIKAYQLEKQQKDCQKAHCFSKSDVFSHNCIYSQIKQEEDLNQSLDEQYNHQQIKTLLIDDLRSIENYSLEKLQNYDTNTSFMQNQSQDKILKEKDINKKQKQKTKRQIFLKLQESSNFLSQFISKKVKKRIQNQRHLYKY